MKMLYLMEKSKGFVSDLKEGKICISSMNSGRHMAEARSGRLQPSMCFSHTVLREYGDLKVSATGVVQSSKA